MLYLMETLFGTLEAMGREWVKPQILILQDSAAKGGERIITERILLLRSLGKLLHRLFKRQRMKRYAGIFVFALLFIHYLDPMVLTNYYICANITLAI